MTRRKGGGRSARRADLTLGSVIFVLVLGAALAVAAFVIEAKGGQGPVPTWDELFGMFDVSPELPSADTLAQGDATVSFLDVGQGDSVLIASEGQYCLIDAGTPDSADELIGMLRAAGVERLDLVVMTHPHADHIGGMDEVLDTFEVGTLLLPDFSAADTSSGNLGRVLQTAEDNAVHEQQAAAGQTWDIGAGQVQVLFEGLLADDPDDLNNTSVCVMYTMGEFAFLSTGDAEKAAERELIERCGAAVRATVFKAGHHGSSTSNTEELLDFVRPELVVISCGLDNDYGHPHAEVLDRFAEYGVQVCRTDRQGTVIIEANADGTWQVLEPADTESLQPAA